MKTVHVSIIPHKHKNEDDNMKYPLLKAISQAEDKQLVEPGTMKPAGILKLEDVNTILQDMEIAFLNWMQVEKDKDILFGGINNE